MVTVVPLSASLSNVISPSCSSINDLQIAKPSPQPLDDMSGSSSPFVKGVVNFNSISSEMPLPVSVTDIFIPSFDEDVVKVIN